MEPTNKGGKTKAIIIIIIVIIVLAGALLLKKSKTEAPVTVNENTVSGNLSTDETNQLTNDLNDAGTFDNENDLGEIEKSF